MKLPFDKNRFYQVLILLNAAVLFVAGWMTFYSYISLPTDENWFRDVRSNIMVSHNFKGTLSDKKEFPGIHSSFRDKDIDSLDVGDLIMAVNGGNPKTNKDLYEMIFNGPDEFRIQVLRPSLNYLLEFKVKKSDVKENYFIRLPNYAYVSEVIPNGASDRAGMKVGDLILRVNEQTFENANEADKILRNGQIGKSLRYDILRNNEFKTLNVVLSKFGVPFGILLFCFSGFAFMLAGAFIAVSRPNIFSARLLGLGLLYVGFFISVLLVRRNIDNDPVVLAQNIATAVIFFLGLPLLFHSSHYFPSERPELISKRWITWSYYSVSIAAGIAVMLTKNLVLIIIVPAFYLVLLFFFRKHASSEYKKLNTVIRRTYTVVAVANGVGFYFLGNSSNGLAFGVTGVTLFLLLLAYLFTIARYRLLDMNFRVRRNTQYSVITTAWSTVMFLILIFSFINLPRLNLPNFNVILTGASIEIDDASNLTAQRIPVDKIILMMLALIVTFGFIKIRKTGQKFIDKKYYR
jgi:hypothetical protein